MPCFWESTPFGDQSDFFSGSVNPAHVGTSLHTAWRGASENGGFGTTPPPAGGGRFDCWLTINEVNMGNGRRADEVNLKFNVPAAVDRAAFSADLLGIRDDLRRTGVPPATLVAEMKSGFTDLFANHDAIGLNRLTVDLNATNRADSYGPAGPANARHFEKTVFTDYSPVGVALTGLGFEPKAATDVNPLPGKHH